MAKDQSVINGDREFEQDSTVTDAALPGYPTDDDFEDASDNYLEEDFEESDNPDEDGLDADEEENDFDGEEDDSEDAPPEITAEQKSVQYFQSRADKAEAALRRLEEEFGPVAGIVDGLKRDPDAARMLMKRWSDPNPQAEQEVKPPEPPEDFDPSLAYTPGTREYKYRMAQQEYDRQMILREAEERAARVAAQQLSPFQEQQRAVAQREQQLQLLSQSGIPPEMYNDFLGWEITSNQQAKILAEAFMRERGMATDKKMENQKKKKELLRVNKNSQKPRGGKVTGESEKAMDDNQSFMAGLRELAARGRSFG